jgi:tetratricopeptide (TPR) repeat protein
LADAERELGNVLRLRVTGGRAENLETAITCFRLALSQYSRDTSPQKWALTSSDLGRALAERIRGERVTNLEEAREHLEEAVAVLGGSAGTMVPYSAVLAELGAVYLWRRRGSKADNAETALHHLSEARQLMEQCGLPPRTRAAVIERLGNAHMARVAGDRAQHVEDAIECYRLALELAGPEEGQLQARLTNNLASAYAQRVCGDQSSNVAQALRLYEHVASFRTREVSPFDWAQTRNDIGTVLAQNPDPADPSRLDRAALAYRDALEVLHPGGPAASVITVGWNLGQVGTRTRRWEDAVDGYQAALDAADARYRDSLLLEARYDELTDMTGLRSELAAALAMEAQYAGRTGESTDADRLLRRAVTIIDCGRMQMLGELTEHYRERERLDRLRARHPDIYQDYLTKAERLREQENEQWREFQQLQRASD